MVSSSSSSSSSSLHAVTVPYLLSLVALLSVCGIVTVAGTNEAGEAFLKANKNKPGVIVLPSGLQYKVLQNGTGVAHPTLNSPCSCDYEGKLLDGSIFDSSYARGKPATFAPNQVIKGWTEAMQLMVVGDKWEMYIPSDLGYGDRGHPPKIPGGDVLIFTMEILKIKGDSIPASSSKEHTKDISETEADSSSSSSSSNIFICIVIFVSLSSIGVWYRQKQQKRQTI